MKKNPLLPVLFFFLAASTLYSQDFNLFNPSNEMYLFSAYDEGSNAFRYNPAVLGLAHRLNISLNAFLENYNKTVYLNEFDGSINAGAFGFAYRRFDYGRNFVTPASINSFTLGFGVGNKTISAGLSIDASYFLSEGPPSIFINSTETKYKFGFGILYRPFEFFSTAFTFKTAEAYNNDAAANRYNLGLALKPLKNNLINLMLDFSVIPDNNRPFFNANALKIGIDANITSGLHLTGSYSIVNSPGQYNFVNLGIGFDFPHSSVKYNNVLSRIAPPAGSSQNYPFMSRANQISLSYSVERKESIVPEKKKILEVSLSGALQDYHTEDVFFGILGKGKRSIHEVITDIDYAAADPSVKGILLKIYPLSTGRFEINAAVEELTASMERFKAKGKKITAYFPEDAGPVNIISQRTQIIL